MLDFGKQVGVGRAAIEQRDLVSAGKRGFDQMSAQKQGPADDQDLHRLARLSIGLETASYHGRASTKPSCSSS